VISGKAVISHSDYKHIYIIHCIMEKLPPFVPGIISTRKTHSDNKKFLFSIWAPVCIVELAKSEEKHSKNVACDLLANTECLFV